MILNPSLVKQASNYLSSQQRSLVDDTIKICSKFQETDHVSDYSFLVQPLAKAYEGFLKDFFLDLEIIDDYNYRSDRFRVGKTLNPSLRFKRFSIYQRLADYHDNGKEIAEILWNAWKFGRNEIFHYFPDKVKNLTQLEAQERLEIILKAIITAGDFAATNNS